MAEPHDDGDMEKEVGLLVSRAWKERENQNLQEQYQVDDLVYGLH